MKKLGYFIFALILFCISIGVIDVLAASAPPAKISLGTAGSIDSYIGGVDFKIKRLSNGGYAYCMDIHKSTPSNVTMTLKGELDAGMAYLLYHGYPNKIFTGNNKQDYYITQSAVWWYLDETTGSSNLSKAFKTTASDPKNLRPHIKKLVSEAVAAKKAGYQQPSLSLTVGSTLFSLSNDGKYYLSQTISIKESATDGTYKVSLENAPSGTIIIDKSGNVKTTFAKGDTFQVKVPVANLKELASYIKVKISGTATIYKAYEYKPTKSSVQNIMPAVPFVDTQNLENSITLSLKRNEVKIVKIDATTNEPLAGATLVLKNSSGSEVARFTTTTSPYVLTDLPAGQYTVSEVSAPNGYVLSTDVVTVYLALDGFTQTVTFKNSKKPVEPSKVTISKKDITNEEELPGAKLVIKDSNSNIVASWTSTTTPHVIENLPNGKYTLIETYAPDGYVLNENSAQFEITDNKRVIKITFYNSPEEKVPTKVVISKKDITNEKELPGAKLQILNSNNEVVASWTSTTTPYVIENLPDGKYTLIETSAPNGYVLNEEKITFEVIEGTPVVNVTMYNAPEIEVPPTDFDSNIFFSLFGIITILLGSVMLGKYAKEK